MHHAPCLTFSCICPLRAAMMSMSSIARALSGFTRLMRATAQGAGGAGRAKGTVGGREERAAPGLHSHKAGRQTGRQAGGLAAWQAGGQALVASPAALLTSVAGLGLHDVHEHGAALLLCRLPLLRLRLHLFGAGRSLAAGPPAAALLRHHLCHAALPDGLQLRVVSLAQKVGVQRKTAGGRRPAAAPQETATAEPRPAGTLRVLGPMWAVNTHHGCPVLLLVNGAALWLSR
jgi:hypothetical protein